MSCLMALWTWQEVYKFYWPCVSSPRMTILRNTVSLKKRPLGGTHGRDFCSLLAKMSLRLVHGTLKTVYRCCMCVCPAVLSLKRIHHSVMSLQACITAADEPAAGYVFPIFSCDRHVRPELGWCINTSFGCQVPLFFTTHPLFSKHQNIRACRPWYRLLWFWQSFRKYHIQHAWTCCGPKKHRYTAT